MERPPKNKGTESLKDPNIMYAVAKIEDKAIRTDVTEFILEFDMRECRDTFDFIGAYQALASMSLYIAPQNEDWRKSIDLTRKILDSASRTILSFLKEEFPAQVAEVFEEIMKSIEEELPEERVRELRRRMDEVFKR